MATQHYNLPTAANDQADVGQLLEDTFVQASGQLTDCAMKKIDDELYQRAHLEIVADEYDPTSTYALKDVVIYQTNLYKCIVAIETAEAWTPAHWTEVTLSELIAAGGGGGGAIQHINLGSTALPIVDETVTIPADTPGEMDVVTSIDSQSTNNEIPTAKAVYDLSSGKEDAAVIDTSSTSPITLTNNKSFRLGTIVSLTINAANAYELDFECEVIFIADTGISITYPNGITWSGDEVSSNTFTPEAGKTYNILFFNNATAVGTPNIQAIVRGV